MSRKMKIWIAAACALIGVGLIMFALAMTSCGWDFSKLATTSYEINTHEISDKFDEISIASGTADIEFKVSDDGECRVVCKENERERHIVSVRGGVLEIALEDDREWYEHIGISYGAPEITVFLPEGEYGALKITEDTGDIEIPEDFGFEGIDISASTGDVANFASASAMLKIRTSTGDIRIENVSAGEIDLAVSTGAVTVTGVDCAGDVTVGVSTGRAKLTDVDCKSLISTGSTGDIALKNVIASESFSIERSTGDVNFDGCDASEINVETDTGDVTGTLRSGKIFITNTDTGDVDVPKTFAGGLCEITTDTGDIKIILE